MMNFIIKKYIVISFAILAIIIFSYISLGGEKELTYESFIIKMSDIVEEVSVTGSIKPVESVDLAFEIGGKVSNINVKIGDVVEAGKVLISLDKGDLLAKLAQAEAGVDSAKAQLSQYEYAFKTQESIFDEMKKGTRAEEIQISETKVANAKKSLSNASTNLENIKQKSDLDIKNLYDSVDDILNDAYTKAYDVVNNKTTGIFSEQVPNDFKLTFNILDASLRANLEQNRFIVGNQVSLFKLEIAGLTSLSDFDYLLLSSKTRLILIRDFLLNLNSAIDSATGLSSTTIDTYRTNVNTGRTNINTVISNINNQIQLILTQKIINYYT
ncbi:MAG: biotin/lipoyl-binding protein [Patescibacteria group bacterium]